MSKLERLLNLTAVLLDTRRPLTADELRQLVDGYPPADASFRRAFERDKDDLRTLGIPLRIERVPATDPPVDGYRIPPEEYYLPDPGLDVEELAALHLAVLTVRVEGLDEREALWKLGGVGADDTPVDRLASLPVDPSLGALFSAITSQRMVSFGYRGEERHVDPWRLSFQRGRWYLSGYDHDRDGERNYRLDRFDDPPTVLDQPWTRAPDQPGAGRTLAAWELGEDETVLVELRVDPGHADIAARQLGPDVARRDDADGSVFTVPVVNLAAFRTFVLGLLDHAEVLGPPEARQHLVDWLGHVAEPAGSRS